MKSYNKEQLLENINYTSLHVAKVNELVAQYHRIHKVPFNSLTAILSTVVILLLMWVSGMMSGIHGAMQDVGTSLVNIQHAAIASENSEAASTSTSPSNNAEVEGEEAPLIDLSFITSFFTGDPKYITSGVIKYAIIVGLLDAILLVGISFGLTYGGFYAYHYYRVKKNIAKLTRINEDITAELSALEQSFIPEEYWHVPYLHRMKRYIEQDRAHNLIDILDLIDLDIRHQQIINAIANDELIDTKSLAESALHPKSKILQKDKNNKQDKEYTNSTTTNLAN